MFCKQWYFYTDTACVIPVPHYFSLALFCTAWLFWGCRKPHSLCCHQKRCLVRSFWDFTKGIQRKPVWADSSIQRVHVVLILWKIQGTLVTALQGRSNTLAIKNRSSFRCNQTVHFYGIRWVLYFGYKSGDIVRLTLQLLLAGVEVGWRKKDLHILSTCLLQLLRHQVGQFFTWKTAIPFYDQR